MWHPLCYQGNGQIKANVVTEVKGVEIYNDSLPDQLMIMTKTSVVKSSI